MNSIQITVTASGELQDILISELSDLGAEGFEQTETTLIAYFNENEFQSYAVNEVLKDHPSDIHVVEEQNWNALWESNFQPVMVNNFCLIRAEFHDPVSSVQHDIIITPKMSFGTGHHATTYMMVEQMSQMDLAGKGVFDFGTGTGILSILAEKLGAANVTAIDNDEWSVKNAKENMEKNKCTRISVGLTDQLPAQKFDIILANINRNVLLQYLPQLKSLLEGQGELLLSGLLTSDEKDIMACCDGLGLRLINRSERNNWISLFCSA